MSEVLRDQPNSNDGQVENDQQYQRPQQNHDEEEEIDVNLSCRICKLYFRDPVAIPCGCTFCKECIKESMQKRAPTKNKFSFMCPRCKIDHTLKDLVVNKNLREAAKRKLDLDQGGGMVCHDCLTRVMDTEDMYVCEDCKSGDCGKLICGRCGMKSHRTHKTTTAEILSGDERTGALNQLQEFFDSITGMNGELDTLYKGVHQRVLDTLETMNDMMSMMSTTIRMVRNGNQLRKPTVDRVIQIHKEQLEFLRSVAKPAQVFTVHPALASGELVRELGKIINDHCNDGIGEEVRNVITEWRRNPAGPRTPSELPIPQNPEQQRQRGMPLNAPKAPAQQPQMRPMATAQRAYRIPAQAPMSSMAQMAPMQPSFVSVPYPVSQNVVDHHAYPPGQEVQDMRLQPDAYMHQQHPSNYYPHNQ